MNKNKFRFVSLLLIYLGGYTPLWLIFLFQQLPITSISTVQYQVLIQNNISTYPLFGDYVYYNYFSVTFLILLGLFLVSLITILSLSPVLRSIKSAYPPVTIKAMNNVSNELILYTLPYVASLVGLKISEVGYGIGFIVFFVFMFYLSIKTEIIFNNPILAILNYNLYDVAYEDAQKKIHNVKLLTKTHKRNQIPPFKQKIEKISENVYIVINDNTH